jgi:NADPH-dependent curcumin reductase CurA
MLIAYGAFAEHIISKERHLIKVPAALPSILPMIVCGLTASIGLAKIGQMGHGETVLVTAAAGGTGQFAVQLAKLAGNHVIGTCSSKEKVQYLHSIGCDRAINYHEENLFQVLKKEYPKGIDLVFEGVGGEMFDICVNNLAIGGRVVVIGFISEYQENKGNKLKENKRLTPKLISKSASIRGFFLNHYLQREQVLLSSHLKKMSILVQKGLLNPGVDPFSFQGLESIPTAIEHMYQRKNKGKIVVQIKSISSRL